MTVGGEIMGRGNKPVTCPACGQPGEPQMDGATHTLYWCGACWMNRRKPFVFEVARPAASATREEQG